jgi:hypothetical protein
MDHHPIAFAVIIAAALTLLAVAMAAPRIAGVRPDHAVLRASVGIAGLLVIPLILVVEAVFNV